MLNTLVGLLSYVQTHLGLFPHLLGSLYLLAAGSCLSHVAHGLSSLLSTQCLGLLGIHIGGVNDGHGVTTLHMVALTNTNLLYPAGYLARYTIFTHFHLTLYHLVVATYGEVGYQGYYGCHYQRKQTYKQYVVIWFYFCHGFCLYLNTPNDLRRLISDMRRSASASIFSL